MQYKKSGHIASKCNNVKACALPSSHLPLTREARTWCEARDSAKQTERSFKGKGVGDFRGIVRFFEESMSVQLYRYTHEIINSLSVWEMLSAVLVIYFTVWL